jgi:hypothetical protein
MAKTWVLDSETKGTGAHMVPLEEALQKARKERDLATITLERPPRPAKPDEPAAGPLTFKVVDVRSGEVLSERLDARATVEVLEDVGSVVDVRIYVWVPAGRWRLLTLGEQRTLWQFRGSAGTAERVS